MGEVADAVLGVAALGDVGDDAQVATHLPHSVAYHRNADVGRKAAAVVAAHDEFVGFGEPGAGFCGEGGKAAGLVGEGPAGDVFGGVEDQRSLMADEFVGTVAEHALGGGVHHPDDAAGVGVDDGVFGAVEDGPLQRGGFAQQVFGVGVFFDFAFEEPVGFAKGLDVLFEGCVGLAEGESFFMHLAADGVGAGLQHVEDEGGQRAER